MEPIDNLVTIHAEEERLRGEHMSLIAGNEELRDHIHMIQEAMNMLWVFTHDHTRKNDDELTMQFLGIRLFNSAASSYSGYYQNAAVILTAICSALCIFSATNTSGLSVRCWNGRAI
jgi:hypothetical protein